MTLEVKRSTKATYTTKEGKLSIAMANELRFEREGALIEGTATNNNPHSRSQSNMGRTTHVIYEQVAMGLDTHRSTLRAGTYEEQHYLRWWTGAPVGIEIGKTYTISFFLLIDERDMPLIVPTRGVAGDLLYRKISEGFYRAEFTLTPAEEFETTYVGINILKGAVVKDISISGFQVETGSAASSYIPTDGTAAVRYTDKVHFPVDQIPFRDPYTMSMDVIYENRGDYGFIDFFSVIGAGRNLWRLEGTGFRQFIGAHPVSVYGPGKISSTFTVTWNAPRGTQTLYKDGVSVDSQDNVELNDPATVTGVALTFSALSNHTKSRHLHVKNIRAWNQVLTPAQIAAI